MCRVLYFLTIRKKTVPARASETTRSIPEFLSCVEVEKLTQTFIELILSGAKKCKVGLDFQPQSPLAGSDFETKQHVET